MHLAPTSTVSLESCPDTGWRLLHNGQALTIRGAGGESRPDLLAALGGNALRTWHTDDSRVLDAALAEGVVVMAGLSVGHERHGFDYTDQARVERQRAGLLDVVRRLKDHPVSIVIAGPGDAKLASFQRYCPHVDILGVNAYGDAVHIPDALARAGVTRPFLLTEFGPTGHWEVRQTAWGAPVEPATREKYRSYLNTHRDVMTRAAGRCLGTFAFLWGHKQEVTPTWYGMFLPTGEKTPAVDAMTLAWSGTEPDTPSPHILEFESALVEATVSPGSVHEVFAKVAPVAAAIDWDWRVLEESTDRKIGGDPEGVPPDWSACARALSDGRCLVLAPDTPGAYRLFLYVRDGKGGGASANFPFRVA